MIAASPLKQHRQYPRGHIHDRPNIEIHHVQLVVGGRLRKDAVAPKAGIIDQQNRTHRSLQLQRV
jgi:hypothetical protein